MGSAAARPFGDPGPDELFTKVLRVGLAQQAGRAPLASLTRRLGDALLVHQSRRRAAAGQQASDLEMAQLHKLTLIGAKLDLRPGMRVLDIGCSWCSGASWETETSTASCRWACWSIWVRGTWPASSNAAGKPWCPKG